ncbi:MAG: DNA polymerase domain-containing protein [Natrialbaceae archaeon]|nr:DNA polymerase domain-containing protein [Natrialbaceae archaeon]
MDPDVLVVSSGDLIPVLCETAAEAGWDDFALGRQPGWSQLAGASTYASYGQVGHSPARYQIPGRAIVNESNSFLWHQAGLPGIEYMVGQTGRPLQEAAWGSIGTLLTSRQIRLAREEWDVIAPWNKWEPESFKDVRTLHAADRGGFTFAPEVGCHEAIHEIDFASLYPRIICEHNVSPETVDCRWMNGASPGARTRVRDLLGRRLPPGGPQGPPG